MKEICAIGNVSLNLFVTLGIFAYIQEQYKNRLFPYKWISCSSIGAMIGLVIASDAKIEDLVLYLTTQTPINLVNLSEGSIYNLLVKGHLFNENKTEKMIKLVLNFCFDREDVTFLDLVNMTGKNLIIVITNFNTSQLNYCSPQTTPDMTVLDALLTTTRINTIFRPSMLRIPPLYKPGYYYDGSISANFPIDTFFKQCSRNYLGEFIIPLNPGKIQYDIPVLEIKRNQSNYFAIHFLSKDIVSPLDIIFGRIKNVSKENIITEISRTRKLLGDRKNVLIPEKFDRFILYPSVSQNINIQETTTEDILSQYKIGYDYAKTLDSRFL